MRLCRRRRGRLAELDARIADATAGAERAAEEAAKSERRRAEVQYHVVRPLQDVGERDQFAAMLRATLISGGGT